FVEIDAAYRPAGEGNEIGGDFYDVFRMGTDEWMVVVGDVRGKGASAASLTSMMRYVIRGAAMEAYDMPEVLATLNSALMADSPGETCTAVLVRLDIRSKGNVGVAVCPAGHPLPLLVTDAGDVIEIGRPGTVLGALPHPRHEETGIDLKPGSTLVLFTDGVPEGRRGDDFFGEERLRELLFRSGSQPHLAQIVADTVVEFQNGLPRDDIAIVTLRCTS
ncbi:MAG: PP2C family protein-serine/threonine phosphatase, partial [Acidimicrobiia bacterium]